jgi:hypothetical protein
MPHASHGGWPEPCHPSPPGREDGTGEIAVVSTHADAWPSPVTSTLTANLGKSRKSQDCPKQRGQEQGEVVKGRAPLGCCDQCVNSTEGLHGISLCSRDAMFLCPVSTAAALPSCQLSFPRRGGHRMHCKRACRTGGGSLSAVARRHSPEGRRRPCLSVSRSRSSVLPCRLGALPVVSRPSGLGTMCGLQHARRTCAGGWCACLADHLLRRLTLACFLPSFLACAADGIPGKGCFLRLLPGS